MQKRVQGERRAAPAVSGGIRRDARLAAHGADSPTAAQRLAVDVVSLGPD